LELVAFEIDEVLLLLVVVVVVVVVVDGSLLSWRVLEVE
jgi:hypothetical protein